MRGLVALAACLSVAIAGPTASGLAPLHVPAAPPSAPIAPQGAEQPFSAARHHGESHLVPDSYIVVLKSHLGERDHARHVLGLRQFHASDLASAAYGFAGHVRDLTVGKMRAYHGIFSDEVLHHIRSSPDVAFVERDSVVWASDIEKDAPWGLARLSHRKPLGFGTFNKYEYEHLGGTGVDAYIIDTGVNIHHEEFEGRAKWGKTIPVATDTDGNGHGTHVAGTVASRKYGVAKNATIIAVKVLGDNGSGTMADVIGGVDWATKAATKKDAEARATSNSAHKGSVANMSLGGGTSPALDLAVDNAVDEGLHFAVAAGNDNRDACTFSPAASPNAITVGASTIGDARAYFSNHGKCVDVFAPGLNIKSTWNTANNAVNIISGTSMASPHIAGLAAYFLSLYPKAFSPSAADFIAAGEPVPEALMGELSYWSQATQQIRFGGWSPLSKGGKGKGGSSSGALQPKVLKKTLIRLSSSGILTDLPANTINKLAFNNYTIA